MSSDERPSPARDLAEAGEPARAGEAEGASHPFEAESSGDPRRAPLRR